jgi:hypothetical protein
MNDEKYSSQLEKSIPPGTPSFIKSKRIEDVQATIKNIQFSKKFRRHVNDNAEYQYVRPEVDVLFNTKNTEFISTFVFDPLDSNYWNSTNENTFSSLVSSAYVEWDNLPDIIGSEVTLYSPYDEVCCYIQSPLDGHNYNVISEIDKKDFYCEGINDYFIDIFVPWVKNYVYGRATIKDIHIKRENVSVTFELTTGRTFSRIFRIERQNNTQNTFEKINPLSDKQTQDNIYDFWDLCRDAIGYIPAESNYEEIIDQTLDVNYNSSWYLEHS